MPAGIQSVERALDIVEHVAHQAEPTGVRELARTLGLKVQTTHNLARTLAMRGYLAQDASRAYVLGPRCFALGARAVQRIDLPQLATPFMDALAQELGESLVLAAMAGNELVWAAHSRGTRTVVANMDHPSAHDAYNCASGRVLLAYAPADDVEAYVRAHPFAESVSEHIRSRRDLAVETKRVRARGHALIVRKAGDTLSAVGAPVFDAAGAVSASLAISMPSPRFRGAHRRAVVDGVLDTARRISEAVGYCPESPDPPVGE